MNFNSRSESFIRLFLPHIKVARKCFPNCVRHFSMATHALNPESGFKIVQNRTGTALLRVYTNKFFGTVPRLRMPRLPPEVVSARVKFRAPVPYYFWARCVYMLKTRSAVPKSCGHRAEILGCRAHFAARVNWAKNTDSFNVIV